MPIPKLSQRSLRGVSFAKARAESADVNCQSRKKKIEVPAACHDGLKGVTIGNFKLWLLMVLSKKIMDGRYRVQAILGRTAIHLDDGWKTILCVSAYLRGFCSLI